MTEEIQNSSAAPMTTTEMASKCFDALHEEVANLQTLNIMVIGKSGVGKSTLINNVFRKRVAEAGVGEPVTQAIRKYSLPNFPVQIYDTPGLELNEEQQGRVKSEVASYIESGAASGDVNKRIHCIWFCISAMGGRIEQTEEKWLNELASDGARLQVPVVVVLTKAIAQASTEELKAKIESMNLPIKAVVPVLAEYWKINEKQAVKPHGLNKLIAVTANCLPEGLNKTLQNVQIVSISGKSEEARKVVSRTVKGAMVIGASPIPVSDAFLIVPLQIKMIAQITAVFGLELDKSILTSVISSTIGAGGATVLGKAVVTNILKLLPVGGQIVGGMISAGTAGALTAALGDAYIRLMEALVRGDIKKSELSTQAGMNEIKHFFEEELGRERI